MMTEEERQQKLEEIFLDLVDKSIELVETAEMRDLPSLINILETENVSEMGMRKLKTLNDRLIFRVNNIMSKATIYDIGIINALVKKNRKSFKVKGISHEEEMDDIVDEVKEEER